ncbi:MAG: HipA domain-containing protein, partial [Pedobacter sp.]
RNCDDHTKNFAFRLKKEGKWELAPAYDICHAFRPGSDWVSQHALSINNKRKDILKEDLTSIGESIKCKKSGHIIEEISENVGRWREFAKDVEVNEVLADAIGNTLLRM